LLHGPWSAWWIPAGIVVGMICGIIPGLLPKQHTQQLCNTRSLREFDAQNVRKRIYNERKRVRSRRSGRNCRKQRNSRDARIEASNATAVSILALCALRLMETRLCMLNHRRNKRSHEN